MHETHLLNNIFKYLEVQEEKSSRKIKKVQIAISEFGSLSADHFLQHYKEAACGTKWEVLELEVNLIPFGPELEITGVEFV
jgi:Zn finger protein HypA/HybF involved in hydrogenase expression